MPLPARTDSSAAASRTVLAIGPGESCDAEIGTTPVVGTTPTVGFSPTQPLNAAGHEMEPSVSVPTAYGARPAATAAPLPELDPPADRFRRTGCGSGRRTRSIPRWRLRRAGWPTPRGSSCPGRPCRRRAAAGPARRRGRRRDAGEGQRPGRGGQVGGVDVVLHQDRLTVQRADGDPRTPPGRAARPARGRRGAACTRRWSDVDARDPVEELLGGVLRGLGHGRDSARSPPVLPPRAVTPRRRRSRRAGRRCRARSPRR